MDASIYYLRPRHLLLLCVGALLLLGVVMVQSAAMNITGQTAWHWNERGTRHLMYAAAAVLTFLIVGRIDYRRLLRPRLGINATAWGMGLAIVACMAVLVPGIGIEVNGARRWLPLPLVQVQPSELAKWATVLFLAWWLSSQSDRMGDFFRGFLPVLAPIGIVSLLVVIQDFGTAVLIGLCALTMLLAGRARLWHLAVVIPPAMGAAAWFVMHKPYRMLRMMAFVDPWAAPQKEGYHMVQSLLSFATGGIPGRGLGNGIQKLGYLPEDTTDFIFAVICEELGLFGAMLVIALYLGILSVCWQVIKQKKEPFGRMLAFGIASMIGLQALINIAVATVSVPTKGLSLPLVSAGGSGLVITCAALGLLASVTRFGEESEEAAKVLPAEDAASPASPLSV